MLPAMRVGSRLQHTPFSILRFFSILFLKQLVYLDLPIANMKHHLMVGTWTAPGRIYTVQFDDEALTLELVKKTEIPEAEPISWMTFSHDKKAIYGAAMKKWNSFAVNSPTEIVHQVSHPVAGHRTSEWNVHRVSPLTLSSCTSSRCQQ